MTETAESVISMLALVPHPFEGWFRESDHVAGKFRTFDFLITAEEYVPWHQLSAAITWRLQAGAPVALSLSADGVTASGQHLSTATPGPVLVPPGTYQTMESFGRWSLLEGTLKPDLGISDRILCPDDWFPGRPLG